MSPPTATFAFLLAIVTFASKIGASCCVGHAVLVSRCPVDRAYADRINTVSYICTHMLQLLGFTGYRCSAGPGCSHVATNGNFTLLLATVTFTVALGTHAMLIYCRYPLDPS